MVFGISSRLLFGKMRRKDECTVDKVDIHKRKIMHHILLKNNSPKMIYLALYYLLLLDMTISNV